MRTRWLLGFFVVSGFCSLLYEVVWLRLAMAAFGVTTPLVSIVLSVFMAGLAVGSWGAGALAERLERAGGAALMRLYALAELVIGLSGIAVPLQLRWGRQVLESGAGEAAWASWSHHLASGLWIALTFLPYCAAMGATFPLAMAYIRKTSVRDSSRSFSYLYVANVAGATFGTLVPALALIELLGFRGTLLVAAALNGVLAAAALLLSLATTASAIPRESSASEPSPGAAGAPALTGSPRTVAADAHGATPAAVETPALAPTEALIEAPVAFPSPIGTHPRAVMPVPIGKVWLWLLFMTGAVSMAMEVVWIRLYTPIRGSIVYTFAGVLASYLAATCLGSAVYRWWSRRGGAVFAGPIPGALAWTLAGLFSLLPLISADPRMWIGGAVPPAIALIALGLAPFCAAIGFLTPLIVDRWSSGRPGPAGAAYAANVVGCILGPLLASFCLLPYLNERWTLVALASPLFAVGLIFAARAIATREGPQPLWSARGAAAAGAFALAFPVVGLTRDVESYLPRRVVRRDHSATVIAQGEGMRKLLFVNGYSMTFLTPITKMMAHLPMAFLPRPPRNVLIVCFGMGSSFRSSCAWGVPTTAVELIPSVPSLFGFFHADAASVLATPGARIVIDDGRRFLERTPERFDVITVDPPPPPAAAGSSLLYSVEFCQAAKGRLDPEGILQTWLPMGDDTDIASIAKALSISFTYVRAFRAPNDSGIHFLASRSPIAAAAAHELAGRLPPRAAADLVEWEPGTTPEGHFQVLLSKEVPVQDLVLLAPEAPALRDDRPVNEYYLLRALSIP